MPENDTNLDELIAAGSSPSGAKLYSPEQLRALAEYCQLRDLRVHTIETYRLEDSDEVLEMSLSLFGPSETAASRSWNDQVQIATDVTRSIADEAANHTGPVIFQVWLDNK